MARRKRKAQVVKDTIFVICGNTKTEKNYFDYLKSRLNNNLGKMKLKTVKLGDNACSPKSLIEDAKKEIKSDGSIESCWFICDKDSFNLDEVIEKVKFHNNKNDVKIKIIWSNISFEIWLLYHFTYFTREMTEKELEGNLNRIIANDLSLKSEYRKSDTQLFEHLVDKELTARNNSKRSVQTHARNGKSVNQSCSATNMYAFFEYIKQYEMD